MKARRRSALLTLPRDGAQEKHFSLSRFASGGMLPASCRGDPRPREDDRRMTAATIRRFSIPSPDELVDRARAMAPEIRDLAEETERNRNVFPHIIDKIRDAELLRTCRPKEFGGFEHDGETALRIALTISAACALDRLVGQRRGVERTARWRISRSRRSARCGPATKTRSPAPASRRPARRCRSMAAISSAANGRSPAAATAPPGPISARSSRRPAASALTKARSSCCRSAMSRSSTTGSSTASPAPAARTSRRTRCSCRRIAC